jgi:hypothetical protein
MSTKGLIKHLSRRNKKFNYSGNHESIATAEILAEMYPNTKNIHGYSIVKGDWVFLVAWC